MKEFMEKWKTNPRFKAAIKLGLGTLFIVFVAIFATANRNSAPNINTGYENIINETNNAIIEVPDKYEYTINITINNDNYQYNGTKTPTTETIIKTSNGITTNYRYENESYYKNENETYIITDQKEIYDVVSYNYLKLETINQYLTKSNKQNDKYLVYLKDIILGNDSEEYIMITINENKINVDYTSLMKLFDSTIESYLIDIEIKEIE